MNQADFQKLVLDRINRCDHFFAELGLAETYQLYYYTLFTKIPEEKALFSEELGKQFTLIDSANGDTFETTSSSFLPPHIRYLRVRPPDDSPIVVAADVLGESIESVEVTLKTKNIPYTILERPTNRIISIISPDSTIAIYFPQTHFLNK